MTTRTQDTASTSGLRRALTASAGLAAVLNVFSAPAAAQGGVETAQTDNEPRRLTAITVEATRREGVTVQDVPVAITAYDADLLEQVNFQRANDLEQLSPSVQITQGQSASAGTTISIRGIGTGSDDFGFEPAVGIFVDGVYRTRTGIGISELPELAGVEVLRGPQGTLFGRNTSAGVVNIRTAQPSFEPEVSATIGYGNFDALNIEFTATGPIAENHASRLDVRFRRRDGFIEDVNSDVDFNNIDRILVRAQHLWEKDDRSLRLIADYSQTQENCCGGIQVGGPLDGLLDFVADVPGNLGGPSTGVIGVTTGGLSEGDDRFIGAFSPARPFIDNVEDFGFSAEYNDDLGFANFTSITAYRDFGTFRSQDIDFSGQDRAFRDGQMNEDRSFTQEFRLQGEAGILNWLVGAFYLNQRIDTLDTIRFGVDANEFADFLSIVSTVDPATGLAGQPFGTLPFSGLDAAGNPVVGAPNPLLFVNGLTGAPTDPTLDPAAVPFFFPPTIDGSGLNDDVFELDTNAIAIFTHNELSITDQLTLTGGIRYNYEKRVVDAELLSTDVPTCDLFVASADPTTGIGLATAVGPLAPILCNPAINTEFNGEFGDARTESEVTGTVKLAYEPTQDLLLFASYARGFKSGSFNLTRSGLATSLTQSFVDGFGNVALIPGDLDGGVELSDLEFEEEVVDAYEIGFKSSWLNGRYSLNATGFFQDVQDFQENVFNGTNFIVVGSDVESFGVEIDALANPIDGLVLQGGFIYVNAERQEDVVVGVGLLPGGVQLGNTPEFVVTGQGTYTRELFPGIEGFANLNFRWNSEATISSIEALEFLGNDAFATLGARIGLQDADGRWRASLFGTNLTDQAFNVTGFGVPEQPGQFAVFPGEPRFWGGEITVTFGG